ncbi:MAG TPA: hypothetical protein VKH37_05875 [Ferruginibacter sp.]|nr:hypothetical protein [Ferruginibacter sp.]
MKRLSYLLIAMLLSSCFSKSNKTGAADDVTHSMICHTANGDFLITHEEIFHATSKSSGPSGTFISGYGDFRYTIRNLQTGEQVTRLVTGDRDEDIVPIGYDGKQLWCYGVKKSVGLHARNPSTMEISIDREKLETENPFLKNSMSTPKVYEAPQYYSFDPLQGSVTLTDLQGNFYQLDPSTLKATATKKRSTFNERFSSAHSTTAYRWLDNYVSMRGDMRKQIDIDRNVKNEDSYLNGEILLEQNTAHLSLVGKKMMSAYDESINQLQRSSDSLLNLYPALKDERQAYLTIKDYHIPSRYSEIKRVLDRKEEGASSTTDAILRHFTNMVLGCDSNVLYIHHANNLTDTSSTLITKTIIKNGVSSPQWTTVIPDIYFEPSKGIKRNPRSEVFKSGNPKFDFEWFGIEGNVLVGIKMLFAFGIDTNTGKLLWKTQL